MAEDDEKRMRYTKNVRKQLDKAEQMVEQAQQMEEYTAKSLKMREKAMLGALQKGGLWEGYKEKRDEILGDERWRSENEVGEEIFDRIYELQEEYYNKVSIGWKQQKDYDFEQPVRLDEKLKKKI